MAFPGYYAEHPTDEKVLVQFIPPGVPSLGIPVEKYSSAFADRVIYAGRASQEDMGVARAAEV